MNPEFMRETSAIDDFSSRLTPWLESSIPNLATPFRNFTKKSKGLFFAWHSKKQKY